MDREKVKKILLVLGVATVGFNRMIQIQSDYLKSLEWRLSVYDRDSEKIGKVMAILNMGYNFVNRWIQMQSYYEQVLQRRLILDTSISKRKRNPPEPRTPMYYEMVVLRLSSSPKMAPNVEGGRQGRSNTPIERQILPALWLLATQDSYRSVADRFDISKGTLFLFVNRFVLTLNGFAHDFIRWPTKAEMPAIRKQFYKIAHFDDWVIGAIDGTYVVIPAPTDQPEVYRTRKCNFAQTLQAICLPSLRFISCFVGFPGDKAYPVFEWLQAPYIRRYVLNDAQELYNRLLSGSRQVIERAVALLFSRFRRLKMLDMSRDSFIPETIKACCVLHNIALDEKRFEDFIKEGTKHVELGRPANNVRARAFFTTDGDQRRGEVAARLHRQKIISALRQSQVQQA